MHSYLVPSPGRRAIKRLASSLTLTAVAAFAFATLAGCGSKEEPETSTTAAPAATAATAPGQSPSGGVPAPDQGKVSTGADPQKAPPYPGMYGKPAGSR